MLPYIFLLSDTATEATETTPATFSEQMTAMFLYIVPFIFLGAIVWFFMIRPERKRVKSHKEMLDNLQIADEVVSAGGIIGRVLSIKDNTVLIETGGDKTRIRVLRTAIVENRTIHENTSEK